MNLPTLTIFKDKLPQFFGLSALTILVFLISSILGISLIFPSGIIIFCLFTWLILHQTKIALFFLIILRMLLDHPNQIFSIHISSEAVLTYSQILGIIIFIAGLIYVIKNSRIISRLPLKILLILYFTFSFLTLFFSIDTLSTVKELLRLADLAILYFISYNITQTKHDFNLIVKILIISSILPALIATYQFFTGIGYTDVAFESPRIFGTLSHPNSLSLYLSVIVALLFYYYFATLEKPGNFKKIVTILIPLYFLIIALTYTRIAWIAVFVFISVIGIMRYRKILFSFILIAIFAYFFSPAIQQRTLDAVSQAPGSSLQWRTVIWKDTINYTLDNNEQFFGFGIGTFEFIAKTVRGDFKGSLAPHNDYVKHFVEGGYTGLMLYTFILLAIFIFIFLNYFKTKNSQAKLYYLITLALFASMAVASLSDNILLNTPLQWVFWIFLGSGLKIFTQKK